MVLELIYKEKCLKYLLGGIFKLDFRDVSEEGIKSGSILIVSQRQI